MLKFINQGFLIIHIRDDIWHLYSIPRYPGGNSARQNKKYSTGKTILEFSEIGTSILPTSIYDPIDNVFKYAHSFERSR